MCFAYGNIFCLPVYWWDYLVYCKIINSGEFQPCHEKTCLWDFWPRNSNQPAQLGIILSRKCTTKVLISLRGCAGWSAPLLFAYAIYRFSHVMAHLWLIFHMDRVKRIWYLSPMRAAKVQASLRLRAVSPEPSLLAHTSSESRGTFRQKARSLAPLNVWACAVKICHDGMLEDTNSLDGAHMIYTLVMNLVNWKTSENASYSIHLLCHIYVKKFDIINCHVFQKIRSNQGDC